MVRSTAESSVKAKAEALQERVSESLVGAHYPERLPKDLLKKREVLWVTGLSRSRLHALVAEGKFPPPIPHEGNRAVAWIASEVHEWVARVIARGLAKRKARFVLPDAELGSTAP